MHMPARVCFFRIGPPARDKSGKSTELSASGATHSASQCRQPRDSFVTFDPGRARTVRLRTEFHSWTFRRRMRLLCRWQAFQKDGQQQSRHQQGA